MHFTLLIFSPHDGSSGYDPIISQAVSVLKTDKDRNKKTIRNPEPIAGYHGRLEEDGSRRDDRW